MISINALSTIPKAKSPEDFVQTLIQQKANVRIYDFMIELKLRFYPDINTTLYEDFSQYVEKEQEYCIDARMFYKYSRLHSDNYTFDLKTCDPNSNIKRVLKSSKMKISKDYLLRIDAEQVIFTNFHF